MQDGETPVYAASFIGHTDMVKLLLENRADPNISNTVSCYCVLVNSIIVLYRLQCCLTTLHIATVYNTYNIYFPQYGDTPLKAARNPDIATLLTTYGATLGDVDNVSWCYIIFQK